MASNFSSPNCSCQSRVARFCATKSPPYPARFLKSPERKSSMTVREASGNFPCKPSVRLEPTKPAPPVTTRLREECNFENKDWRDIDKSWTNERKRRVRVRKNGVRNALHIRFHQAISSARLSADFGGGLRNRRIGSAPGAGRMCGHRNRQQPRFCVRSSP